MWSDEFLNVLATNIRTGKLDRPVATEVWELAHAIVAEPPPVEVGAIDVMDLSVQSGVATYDCSYVQLARVLGVRLVTNDKQVLSRFADVAVSIRDFAAGRYNGG
jgi:predicted nucleic acid-binding protein